MKVRNSKIYEASKEAYGTKDTQRSVNAINRDISQKSLNYGRLRTSRSISTLHAQLSSRIKTSQLTERNEGTLTQRTSQPLSQWEGKVKQSSDQLGKDEESTITERTKLKNHEIYKLMKLVDFQTQFHMYQLNDLNLFRKTNNNDDQVCKSLINESKIQIKELNRDLKALVAPLNQHHLLEVGNPLSLELYEDHYSFFKIVPHSQKSPVVFRIEQLSQLKHKFKFQAFISTLTKEPKSGNCEKMIVNEPKFTFKKGKDGQLFPMDTKIFMTVLPKQNCTVTIEIFFPLDLELKKRLKGKQELRVQKEFIDDDGQVQQVEVLRNVKAIEASFDRILKEDDEKLMLIQASQRDHVKENKGLQRKWSQARLEKIQKLRQSIVNKSYLAQQRKLSFEREIIQRRYFLLNRKEILQQKKQELLQQKREYLQVSNRNRQLISLVLIDQITRIMYRKFQEKKRQIEHYMKLDQCSKVIGSEIKNLIRKKGFSYAARLNRTVIMSLSLMQVVVHQKAENKSQFIFKAFLENSYHNQRLRQSFLDFYQRVVYIQQVNRARVSSVQNRIMFLRDYWEQEKLQLTGKLLKKKSKKVRPWIKRMNMLPESVKERIVFVYFQYCKFNFIVKYLEWRSKKLLFYGKPVTHDFFDEIEKLREMCQEREKLLFTGIDPYLMTTVMKIPQNGESPKLGAREGASPSSSPKRKLSPAMSEAKSPISKQQKSHSSSGKNLIKLNFMSQQQEQGFDDFVIHKDPGNPPIFIFMPSKDQLNRMILKALKIDTPEMIV